MWIIIFKYQILVFKDSCMYNHVQLCHVCTCHFEDSLWLWEETAPTKTMTAVIGPMSYIYRKFILYTQYKKVIKLLHILDV